MNGYQIAFTGLDRQYKNLRQETLDKTDEIFSTGKLMLGKYTEKFESWLSFKNQQTAITCHSGTQALEIVAEWYKQTHDGTVFLPAFTFIATKNAFQRSKCKIVYVDVDDFGIINYQNINAKKNDLICIVGLYGAPLESFETEAIILEDGAQHWCGNDYKRIGQITTISFDPMKNLPCYGNGGAIVSCLSEVIEFSKKFRHHHHPEYTQFATNSKMSELDCALLLIKSSYLNEWQERRNKIAKFWKENIKYETVIKNHQKHAFQKFVIKTDEREKIRETLKNFGIDTRINYSYVLSNEPIATKLSQKVLSIPIYPELTDNEVEYIADKLC
jgi:dTDP-4-amino-4,6-dideoxygalactose transaminase